MNRAQAKKRRDPETEGNYVGMNPLRGIGRRLKGNDPSYDYEHSRDSLERRYIALEDQYDELSRKCEKQAGELLTAEALVNTQRKENTQIKKGADKMLLSMEKKELFIGPQMEDEVVRSSLLAIIAQITTWSRPFASRAATDIPPFSSIEPAFATEMRQIMPGTPDVEYILSTTRSRREFVRG